MRATAPLQRRVRLSSARMGGLVPLLAFALFLGSAPASAGTSAQLGNDPLRCSVTQLAGHSVRCDYLTGGTSFPRPKGGSEKSAHSGTLSPAPPTV